MAQLFLRNKQSILELAKTFYTYIIFFGLMPNFTKCADAGVSFLKGVKMAICGMKSVDLMSDTLKILGVHFSYNKTL